MTLRDLLPLLPMLYVSACHAPTETRVEITTDVPCSDVHDTSIAAATWSNIDAVAPAAVTSHCDAHTGYIGSLVIVPGEQQGPLAVRVVLGTTKSAEQCLNDDFAGGCIVARRSLAFVAGELQVLPIHLEQACMNVTCGLGESCVSAACAAPPTATDGGTGDSDVANDEDDDNDDESTDATTPQLDAGASPPDASAGPATDPWPGVEGCRVDGQRYTTVQSAIDDGQCATVLVPAGTWHESLVISRAVELRGVDRDSTVVDANDAGVTVSVEEAAAVVLRELTITGGHGSTYGAGIASAGTLTLRHVTVTGNRVTSLHGRGAGIAALGGSLTLLTGTRIVDNRIEGVSPAQLDSGLGAGIYVAGAVLVAVDGRVTVAGNVIDAQATSATHARGAGIYLQGGATLQSPPGSALTVDANQIVVRDMSNASDVDGARGAGIHCEDSTVKLQGDDVVSANVIRMSAQSRSCEARGAGLSFLRCGASALEGSSVTDNAITSACADGSNALGPGIYAEDSLLSVSRSAMSDNAIDDVAQPDGGLAHAMSTVVVTP